MQRCASDGQTESQNDESFQLAMSPFGQDLSLSVNTPQREESGAIKDSPKRPLNFFVTDIKCGAQFGEVSWKPESLVKDCCHPSCFKTLKPGGRKHIYECKQRFFLAISKTYYLATRKPNQTRCRQSSRTHDKF